MSDEIDRIKRLPPYVFEEVNRLKADLRAKGKDIIDFGTVSYTHLTLPTTPVV